MSVTILIAAASLAIWMYLLLVHGGFWRVRPDASQAERLPITPRVVAIVPARNEARVVSRSIRSLLLQDGVDLHAILVDDGSTDGTADIALDVAKAVNRIDRFEVIKGKTLPSGWSGKLWAVQQGMEAAAKYAPDFLLLTDADIEHQPDNVSRLVERAEREHLDLASFMVKLHCSSLAEKLLIPTFVFFFFQLYPPRWIAQAGSRTAGAAGGCILIRPAAMSRAGGIESIRGEIIDDCSLAARVKRTGGRQRLSLTESAHSIRPYKSFGEIGRMISRTAFNQLRHSGLLLLVAIVGLSITYVAPVALLFSGNARAMVCSVLALVLMTTAYLPMVRFYRLNSLWALTLPLAAVFYMGATIHSAICYWSGRGGQWKGRVQDRAGAAHV